MLTSEVSEFLRDIFCSILFRFVLLYLFRFVSFHFVSFYFIFFIIFLKGTLVTDFVFSYSNLRIDLFQFYFRPYNCCCDGQ